MNISLKIVAVMLVCGMFVSEAQRPPVKGGNANSRPTKGPNGAGPRRIPSGFRVAGRFCGALVSGKIKNDNATFNEVFTSVTNVCKDVRAAWIEDDNQRDEGEEGDIETKSDGKGKAVRILLRVCGRMDKKIPVDVSPIINRFNSACVEARKLAGPGLDVADP